MTPASIRFPSAADRCYSTAWLIGLTLLAGCDQSGAGGRAAITPALIKNHVRVLSHDSLRGRDTGEKGFEIARDYVAAEFKRIGLEPVSGGAYPVRFDVLVGRADMGSSITLGGRTLRAPDATLSPDWLGRQPVLQGEGVFAGFGLSSHQRDDYAGADVRGKVVFIIPGAPPEWLDDAERARMVRTKLENAYQRGAIATILLQAGPAGMSDSAWNRQQRRPATPMVIGDGTASSFRADVTVGPVAARRLLSAWGFNPKMLADVAVKGFPPRPAGRVSVTRRHRVEKIQSWNVVGMIRGHDPRLRDEAVIYTAHLDHIGVGEPDETGDSIYNGAHDNALGVGKLLATAEGMSQLAPKRTVLFLAMGAEERGLLGSWHYVRNPLWPLEKTAAAINQDGGLEGPATDDIFGFGAEESTLDLSLDRTGAKVGMRVNREFPPPFSPSQALLFRSDQYPFLLAGVPAIYLMDGFSIGGDKERGRKDWDTYISTINHRQRDNFDEAWSFESPARMAGFALSLGFDLADRAEMPQLTETSVLRRNRGTPAAPYFREPQIPRVSSP